METMKTASVNGCYSSIMLKVTVMAVAAPFYGKKGSALQPHLKDLFQKISPRRPNIPCTKPEQTDFCMQPKEIHPSYCCRAWRNRRQVSILPPVICPIVVGMLCLPAWWGKHLRIFCWPVHVLTADGSGPCHVLFCVHAKPVLQQSCFVPHKTRVGAFGFVQHLVVGMASPSNTWDILWMSDFQLLLETRLWCILSGISQLPVYTLFQVISNLKRVTTSMWSSDFLRVKIMDLQTGPLPCLWFCSCSQWRHNRPRAVILHLCARKWLEVTIGYLPVYIL